MSPTARAIYGALCGALLTLFIHPLSRPYMMATYTKWGPCRVLATTPLITDTSVMLPQPTGPLEGSLWMQAGADRLMQREPIEARDIEKLIQVARRQAEEEPLNAFWRQMEAAFLSAAGRQEEALQAWMRAATADRWIDHQAQRLTTVVHDMAHSQGAAQAWQLAAVYHAHSTSIPRLIELLSRSILAASPMDEAEGLRMRYATLANGRLMRDGSRSVAAGEIAANIVEMASQPSTVGNPRSPRRLLLARYALINGLRDHGMPEQAEDADSAFLQNEGWQALTQQGEPERTILYLTWGALLVATVPSVLVMGAVFGGLLWGFGRLSMKSKRVQALFRPPVAPVVGVFLAIVVYQLTKLPMAALATVACFCFLAFRPEHERSRPTQDLGPAFQFTLVLLAASFIVMLGAFLIGVSTPGFELLEELGVPPEFFGGSTLFLGLAGIVLGLLLLSAPSWAIVQRIPTPTVVGLTLRNFGAGLGIGCLFLSVVTTPLAIYFDRQLSESLVMLVQNEPVYYLVK